ncbi:hypothetical protein B566_EDAN016722 [Ephemera danica]|nr:hypothetical protein B566_EDAN016722 [Ephemera danica]
MNEYKRRLGRDSRTERMDGSFVLRIGSNVGSSEWSTPSLSAKHQLEVSTVGSSTVTVKPMESELSGSKVGEETSGLFTTLFFLMLDEFIASFVMYGAVGAQMAVICDKYLLMMGREGKNVQFVHRSCNSSGYKVLDSMSYNSGGATIFRFKDIVLLSVLCAEVCVSARLFHRSNRPLLFGWVTAGSSFAFVCFLYFLHFCPRCTVVVSSALIFNVGQASALSLGARGGITFCVVECATLDSSAGSKASLAKCTEQMARLIPNYNQRANVLDLSLVSAQISLRCNTQVQEDPMGSDHLPVITTLSLIPTTNKVTNHGRKWGTKKANWTKYKETCLKDFSSFIPSGYAMMDYHEFISTLKESANKSLSTVTDKQQLPSPPNPWWDLECEKEKEKKKNAVKENRRVITLKSLQDLRLVEENAVYKMAKKMKNNMILTQPKSTYPMDITKFADSIWPKDDQQVDDNYEIITEIENGELHKPFILSELEYILTTTKDTAPGSTSGYKVLDSTS